jgi:hypothetical protein
MFEDKEFWERMTVHTDLSELVPYAAEHPSLIKIQENIWVIKNFVPPEVNKIFTDYAESTNEEDWWKKNRNWWVGKYLFIDENSSIKTNADELMGKINELVSKDIITGGIGSIHRLTPGQEMFIHTDNPTESRQLKDDDGKIVGTTEGHNNYCILAMVLYHNDFKGGNLFFPNLGIEYHGERGDLVIFPGTGVLYDHGVRKTDLDSPNRYISTAFGYDKRGEEIKKSGYVFEDPITGAKVDPEPATVEQDPYTVVNNTDGSKFIKNTNA